MVASAVDAATVDGQPTSVSPTSTVRPRWSFEASSVVHLIRLPRRKALDESDLRRRAVAQNEFVVTLPAFVWRGGFARRALLIGGCVGLSVGILAWLDSGFLVSGAIVAVVVGTFFGIWMARRMAHYWPGAELLSGDDRVTVVRAVRRGDLDGDGLAGARVDYARGLRAAAEAARPLRWLLVFALVVAFGAAVWDATFGSWGNAIASVAYLVALLVEVLWSPKKQAQLLANADRAALCAESRIEKE